MCTTVTSISRREAGALRGGAKRLAQVDQSEWANWYGGARSDHLALTSETQNPTTMPQIIKFPTSNEREWYEMLATLRETYKNMPHGQETFEGCLPAIRSHWDGIFVSFDVQPAYQIPGPLTQEQEFAIEAAVSKGVHLIAERLNRERARCFGQLVACEYKAAYFLKHGTTS